jgi:hypothetical protein
MSLALVHGGGITAHGRASDLLEKSRLWAQVGGLSSGAPINVLSCVAFFAGFT